MPKDIKLKSNLPSILCRPTYEILLIGWVTSRITIGAGFKIQTAVAAFLEHYNIPEDYWSEETATVFLYNNLDILDSMNFNSLTKIAKTWE